MDDELFEKQLEMLEKACTSEAKDIKQIVASVVKTYHRPGGTKYLLKLII